MQTASVVILSNGSATSSWVQWPGGAGVLDVIGTFGGTTVTMQHQAQDGSTGLDLKAMDTAGVQTTVSLTANGSIGFALPPCLIRVVLTGGAASAMYAIAMRIPE